MERDNALNEFTFRDGAIIYLLAIGVNIVFQSLLSGIVMVFNAQHILDIDWVNMLFSLFLQMGFAACVSIYCYKKKTRFSYCVKKTHAAGYGLGAAVAVVCMACFLLSAQAFQWLLDIMGYRSMTGIEFKTLPAKIIGTFVTVVAAPIGEELIFRGALLSGLKKRYNELTSVVLCGLAFALMHMNPEQTVYQFLLGCALAYITLKSGSVIPAMIGHSFSNLIAVLMELIPSFERAVGAPIEFLMKRAWLFIIVTIVLLAVGIAAVYFIGKGLESLVKKREEKRSETQSGETKKDDTPSAPSEPPKGTQPHVFYLIGIGISLLMWASVFIMSLGLLPV